ncbi:MAG: hypothetical protein QXP42_05180 [Candidatus Micrarchaeia archaeon]
MGIGESVDLVTKIFSRSFAIYRENNTKFLIPLIIVFILSIPLPNIYFTTIIATVNCLGAFPVFLPYLFVVGTMVTVVIGLMVLLHTLILSMLHAIRDLIMKRQPSVWHAHFWTEIGNGLRCVVIRIGLFIVLSIPFIIAFILIFLRAVTSWDGIFILVATLILFIIIIIILVNFLAIFVPQELALARSGILKAVSSSISLIFSNFLLVFLFALVWAIIGILMTIGSMPISCCCVTQYIPKVVGIFVLLPVNLISNTMLWLLLKGQISQEEIVGRRLEDKKEVLKSVEKEKIREMDGEGEEIDDNEVESGNEVVSEHVPEYSSPEPPTGIGHTGMGFLYSQENN